MKRWPAVLAIVGMLLPALACVGEAGPIGPVAAQDQILARAVVPEPDAPQGEVQIVRRGNAQVVRTLLASRVLRRVVAVIDAKERRNWPESRDGALASTRYREELFRAAEVSWESFRKRPEPSEVRQFLAIEFQLDGKKGTITLALPVLDGDYGAMRVAGQQILNSWRAPVGYVQGNMLEIVKDSFRLDEAAAASLLEKETP